MIRVHERSIRWHTSIMLTCKICWHVSPSDQTPDRGNRSSLVRFGGFSPSIWKSLKDGQMIAKLELRSCVCCWKRCGQLNEGAQHFVITNAVACRRPQTCETGRERVRSCLHESGSTKSTAVSGRARPAKVRTTIDVANMTSVSIGTANEYTVVLHSPSAA